MYEGSFSLERCHFKGDDHLRNLGLHRVVGWFRCCTSPQSGVAGRALELGSSTAYGTQGFRLGVVSPNHGGAMDMGISMANTWTTRGISWNRCLEPPCREQCVQELPLDLL
jgi:hypothetical protein